MNCAEIDGKLNKAITALAEENDPDKLGKGRERVDRLSNLIGIFNAQGLDFSGDWASGRTRSAHDPTCSSGSLLLKVAAEAPHGPTLYGQEMDNATSARTKMNMILHDCTTGAIEKGDTLSSPQFRDAAGQLKTFDHVGANPPFSSKARRSGLQPQGNEFGRFVHGAVGEDWIWIKQPPR